LAFTPLFGCRPEVPVAEANIGQVPGGAPADYVGMVVTPTAKPFVIMSDDGMKYSFTVVPQTKIKVEGKDAKLDAIKPGDKAAVSATEIEGQVVATHIDVESTAAASGSTSAN
jgi:hypothetical protein